MDASEPDATDDAVARMRGARPTVEPGQCDSALARLRSALFAAPSSEPQLTRYPVVRRIGVGGVGVVYLAHDVELDRPVAIKVLGGLGDRGRSGSSGARERLLREAKALARAPHPHVLAVFDVGTFVDRTGETCTFLVLEYVEGVDLRMWLERSHPWRRVLEVFVAAGRGLAAAHAEDVTHRDFKPANAMLGDDGRVRVLDFGLARAGSTAGPEPYASTRDGDDSSASLTADGTILGTPAYMAPEQHDGAMADAASDQYSFCVALWEGLFDARPFSGHSLAALASAKREGPPEPPRNHSVPAAIVRALRRGLAPDPARRFASMFELVAVLARGSAPRPTANALVIAALATSVAGSAWWLAIDSTSSCAELDGELFAPPGGTRRAAIDAAFAASAVPSADDLRARLGERIDDFAAAWSAAHRELCEPTVAPDESLDLRMACLRRQQREADALLGVLADADATVVARALEIADALPDPTLCHDAERLASAAAPPVEPRLAARVAELRDELARVRALDRAGRVVDALASARAIADEAETLGHAPLLAEAWMQLGIAEEASGDYDRAAETLERAQTTAVACDHEDIAARAAQSLVFVEGDRRGHLDRALAWAQRATVEFERAGGSDDPSTLLSATASAYRVAGRYRDAKAVALEALATHERLGLDDDANRAMLHNNLGDILRSLEELDAAAEHLQTALALWEGAYGPDHPKVAMALNNLGAIDLVRGDTVSAEARYRRVVAIREHAFGPEHPMLATSLANLGVALRRNHQYAEARAMYRRALTILREPDAGPDARVAGLYIGLGLVDAAEGDHRAALAAFDEALRQWEAVLPAEHPDIARGLQNRALTWVELGDLERGSADLERSLEISAAVYGRGHPKLAASRLDFAELLAEKGEHARARAMAQHAREQLADPSAAIAGELDAWLAAHAGAVQ